MSGVKKQVETPFSRPSQSLEFASKKRSGVPVICSRELRLMDVPYLQCNYGEKSGKTNSYRLRVARFGTRRLLPL